MIPYKAPNNLLIDLPNGFAGVVNTWRESSLRILNPRQLKIYELINGVSSVSDLSEKTGLPENKLQEFLGLLAKTEIIRFDQLFSEPPSPNSPETLNLWIHSTNKCNLTCSYCYISTLNQPGRMSEVVKEQLLFKMYEAAVARNLRLVKIRLAGGEPLIEFRNWRNFIINAKKKFSEIDCVFSVAFVTNLTGINQEILDFAKEYDIAFGVSIDGFDTYHDESRKFVNGTGSFDVVDKNLRLLRQNNLKVSTSTVISNRNIAGLPALTEYLIEKEVNFRYSIVKGEQIDREILRKNLTASYQIMERAISSNWQFSKYHTLCDLKPSHLGSQTCSSGHSGAAVYLDGGVYFCHVQFGKENVFSASLFDEKKDLIAAIGEMQFYEGKKSEDCFSCRYKHVCTSGCPMYRENGKDPNCDIYHEFLPIIYRLQALERLNKIINRQQCMN